MPRLLVCAPPLTTMCDELWPAAEWAIVRNPVVRPEATWEAPHSPPAMLLPAAALVGLLVRLTCAPVVEALWGTDFWGSDITLPNSHK